MFYRIYRQMSSLIVVQRDELFRSLWEVQEGKLSLPNSKLISTIGLFRKTLSLAWLRKWRNHDPLSCLAVVISTLVKFTEHQDAGVRVIAYSTLGALLIGVAPFEPNLFIKAFGVAVAQAPVSPRSSIAIINMFIYLSKFVSPVALQSFIIVVPVLAHFRADVSDFLKYLPQSIPLMRNLPLSFQKCFLENLLITCSKRLNSSFTGAVASLLALNKKQLLPVFISVVKEKNMIPVVVSLGPTLIGDRETYELLEDDGRELFLKCALDELERATPKFMEFEASCLTCACFLRYAQGTENRKKLEQKIFAKLRKDYPPHFRRLYMLLPRSLDSILPVDERDPDSMKASQLAALASFILDHPESGAVDDVAKVFFSFAHSKNDLYCSLIESLTKCISLMLNECKKDYHIQLLRLILEKENINWVHDMAVANLLSAIDCNVCSKIFPGYFDIAIERLLRFAVSLNNRLFSAAIAAIQEIVSYETIDHVLMMLFKSDFTEESCVTRRFELLSLLSSRFKSSLFELFVPIAYECLLLHGSVNIVSKVCAFLASMKVDNVDTEIIRFCFSFITVSFEGFTQLSIPNPDPVQSVKQSHFLDTVDTDIVTNPAFDHQVSMAPMRHCFEFLCSLPLSCFGNLTYFFQCCLHLVPLFDQMALLKAFEISESGAPVHSDDLWDVVFNTFRTTSNDYVAATCAKLLCRTMKPIPDGVEVMIEKTLIEQNSTCPELLYYCFILVDQKQHDKAIQAVPTMAGNLDDQTAAILLFKLVLVIGRSMVDAIEDRYAISLLQYANFYGGTYEQRVQKYLNSHSFDTWPLDEGQFNDELVTFLSKSENRIRLDKFDDLDYDHLVFLVKHSELFNVPTLVAYIQQHPQKFAKIDTSKLYQKVVIEPVFCLEPLGNVPHIASATPFLVKGMDVDSIPLLTSFLRHASVKTSQDQFDRILTKVSTTVSGTVAAVRYARRMTLKISDDFVLSHDIFKNHLVFPEIAAYWENRGIGNFPAAVVRFIEEQVGHPITDLSHDVLVFEPDRLLHEIVSDPMRICYRHFRLMMSTMHMYDVSPLLLNELIAIHISVFDGITSSKKKALLLRLISSSLDYLRSRKLTVESGLIEDIFAASFELIAEDTSDVIAREIVEILKSVIPSARKVSEYATYISNYNSNHVVPMAQLYHYHRQSLVFVPAMLESEHPSELVAAIRALELILDEQAPVSTVEIVNQCIPLLFSRIAWFSENIATSRAIVPLICRIFETRSAWAIPDKFFEATACQLLLSPDLPYYETSLPLCQTLADMCPKVVDEAFSVNVANESIVNALWKLFELRKGDQVACRAVNDRISAFFVENPCFGHSSKMADAAKATDNAEATGFFLLNHIQGNFLPFFVVLMKLAELSETFKMVFVSVAECFAPKSRIESVVNHKNLLLSFLMAAAETDDVEKIRDEINLVCK